MRMADTTVRTILDFKAKRQHADIRCRACGWHVIVPPDSVQRMSWGEGGSTRHVEARALR